MDNTNLYKSWKILCWNVRGLNSKKKWDCIRDKISESHCDVIFLQETKKENFDLQFIRKFCPPSFDCFEYLPSVGASGGVITIWKSHIFTGQLIYNNEFRISVEFSSNLNACDWVLTNVYGPCTTFGKILFVNWLKNIDMPDEVDWLLHGDFNLLRRPSDRNKSGGDVNEMFSFSEAISALGVVELPLLGRKFTWSNKKLSPLLETLDWLFPSNSWTSFFS